MKRSPLVLLVVIVFGTLLSVPAGAAASYYASATGSGSACTQVAPCDLPTAISKAASGDDVFALADHGDYHFNSTVGTNGVAFHLHGLNGRARLIFSGGQLRLNAGTADGLYVESDTSATALSIQNGASADRVIVKAGAPTHACFMQGGTLTNSICWAGSSGDLALETDGSNTLRNDSLVGGTEAAFKMFARNGCTCTSATDTLVNVIARSAAGGVDLEVNSDGSATANVNVTHSNYATTSMTGAGAPSKTTITADATDQNAAPAFVDAAAGDFHEAPGSPTIDKGVNDAANGSKDLDGNPRTLHGMTDIGAYEFVPPPDTKITKATINAAGHKASFSFKAIGAATGLQCQLKKKGKPTPAFSVCHSPKAYQNLKAGNYTFAARAVNSAGPDPTPATKAFTI